MERLCSFATICASGPCKAALMARSFWRDPASRSFQSSPQPSVQQNQRLPGASDAASMNPTYRSTSSSRICSANTERSTSSSASEDVAQTAKQSSPRGRSSSRRLGLKLQSKNEAGTGLSRLTPMRLFPAPLKPVTLQQVVSRFPYEQHRQPSRHSEELISLAGVHRHLEDIAGPR